MAECFQCSNNATATTLITGFDLNGNAKTMTISNRCWTCTNKINEFMKRDYNERMQEARKNREDRQKAEEARADAEKEKKFNEWKSSHCNKCGKYSNIYHYVYDKRYNRLTKTNSNATNPNEQWVFCTREHFQEWYDEFHYKCLECGKNGLGNYVYHKDNKNIRFCSRDCSRAYCAEKCDDCSRKVTGNSYYRDSVNKTGTLCENCFQIKELEAELAKLNSPTNCQGCNKQGTKAEMSWHNPSTNDGKKFCSEKCCLDHYVVKCDKCNREIKDNEKSYYNDFKNKTGTLCLKCKEEQLEERKRNQNSSSNSSTVPSKEEDEKKKTKL